MSYLQVAQAVKQFTPEFRALDNVSVSVERGEFFTLLGPSGCGKTTLLRAIAGFNDLTSGSITLDGEDLRKIPPHKRDIGMVFQDYAVFPHLSVFDNVAFGLKPRKVAPDDIRKRVEQALAGVHLSALAQRMPAAMSGGQQQRIGIARALVINPRLLLMDEPLSNLDAKLRIELREEIRDIQKEVNIAAIYVTHDQEEALAISDRICVMSAGHIEQMGTPQQIYGEPQTIFVARFVGTLNELKPDKGRDALLDALKLDKVAAETWAVRPEKLALAGSGDRAESGKIAITPAKVVKYTYLGREAHVLVDTDFGSMIVHLSNPGPKSGREPGEDTRLIVERDALMAFAADGKRIVTSE
jgi:ABC-type Fe3+/spermidine/putrescine transport system ATPase subunit